MYWVNQNTLINTSVNSNTFDNLRVNMTDFLEEKIFEEENIHCFGFFTRFRSYNLPIPFICQAVFT